MIGRLGIGYMKNRIGEELAVGMVQLPSVYQCIGSIVCHYCEKCSKTYDEISTDF